MKCGHGIVPICLALSACASNPLPPANGVRATFDPSAQAIQVVISNNQAPHDAFLVDADGRQYPVVLTLISGPHVNYSVPPSIGLGLGGFGGGVGGGLGFGVPLGGLVRLVLTISMSCQPAFGRPIAYKKTARRRTAYPTLRGSSCGRWSVAADAHAGCPVPCVE